MNTPINEAVERADPVTKEDLLHAIFDKVARAEDLMADQPPHRAMERFNEASATLKSMIDQLFEARAALPPPIVEPVKMTQELYNLLFSWATYNIKRGYSLGAKARVESELLAHIGTLTTPASAPSDGAADARDAARWRAFRARDEFDNLQASDFIDCFREEADATIDEAIASTHTTTGGEND